MTVTAETTEVAGLVQIPPSRELTVYDGRAGSLRVPTAFGGFLEFGADQRVLSKEQMVLLSPLGIEAGWDPRVVATFLMECHERGLDPWQREAYLMLYAGKFIRHIGIDGFRKRGEATGEYRGRKTPLYCGDDEKWREVWPYKDAPPYAAKVGVDRASHRETDYAIALYDEYVPMQDEYKFDARQNKKVKTGVRLPTPNWRAAGAGGKPTVMLGKCAEAQAWRAAFPNRFGGFYAPEEFDRLRAESAQADPAATARRAAYEAEQGQRETIRVQATVGEPAVPQMDDDDTRAFLLAELDEQAEVLGRTVADLCQRWSESRGGQPIAKATVKELADHVHRIRPYVMTALRDQNREAEAVQYASAPAAASVHELFGRGPAVVEPPADEVQA
jgi:phage recombination protein Bet